jgi:copper chaperone CopZ
MALELPRLVFLAHDSPGRLRVRLSWLHDAPDEAPPLAAALAAVDGVREVKVRAYTGSVLILYDPARLAPERLRAALCKVACVDHVLGADEEPPDEVRALLERSLAEGSELARIAARSFKGLDLDFLRLTGGRVSLGSLVSLGLIGAAVGRVAASGELALPEWHQLLWWGFRSFTELEEDALETAERGLTDEEIRSADQAPHSRLR